MNAQAKVDEKKERVKRKRSGEDINTQAPQMKRQKASQPEPLNRHAYQYRASWEWAIVEKFCSRLRRAWHVSPAHTCLPKQSAEEERDLLSVGEVSSEESKTPSPSKSTPATALSPPSPPQVLGSGEADLDGDKVMAGLTDNLQSSSLPEEAKPEAVKSLQSNASADEEMSDAVGVTPTHAPRDEDMADATVGPQRPVAENADMTGAQESSQKTVSQESSREDSAMEGVATAYAATPSPVLLKEEMEGVTASPTGSSSLVPSSSHGTSASVPGTPPSPPSLSPASIFLSSSEPTPSQSATVTVTLPTFTQGYKRGTLVLKQLAALGQTLHRDLQHKDGKVREEILQFDPQIEPEILKRIFEQAQFAHLLVKQLRHHLDQGRISLAFLRSLRDFARKVQAAKVPQVAWRRNNSLADACTPLLLTLFTRDPAPKPAQQPAPQNAGAFVQRATPAPRAVPQRQSTPKSKGDDVPSLEIQGIIARIQQAHASTLRKPWASNVRAVFDLPFNDLKVMKMLARCLIRSAVWGNGDVEVLKEKIEGLYLPRADLDESWLVWTCCMVIHRNDVTTLPMHATRACSYEATRLLRLKDFHKEISTHAYHNLRLLLTASCFTWEQMETLAKQAEQKFFLQRAGTTASRTENEHKKFMEALTKEWDLKYVRTLIKGMAPSPSSCSTCSTDLKRPTADEPSDSTESHEPSESKRARQDEQPAPPPQPSPPPRVTLAPAERRSRGTQDG